MFTNSGNATSIAVVENVAVKKNKNNASMKVVNAMAVKNGATNVAKPKNQMGGVAPVNFHYSKNMQQPPMDVMRWAVDANAPTPSPAVMRTVVAHGGARKKTRKHKRSHKHKRVHKKSRKHKKGKSHKKSKKSRKHRK